jgi:UPF0755 protein
MKKIGIALIIIIAILVFTGYTGYKYINGSNVILSENEAVLTIPPGSSYQEVLDTLRLNGWLKNEKSFDLVARMMKYNKEKVPAGKYSIKNGMSNRSLIGKLRSGSQMPINITYNNMTYISDLSGQLARYFYVDSLSILNYLNSPEFLSQNNVNRENALSLFIPNTYQMYWDYPIEKIIGRLIAEKEKFWNQNNRLAKVSKLNMSPAQVYTLASIVEKESNYIPERKTIAGLYLNRLARGIPLQADPTVKFAIGRLDLRRVLLKHLEYDSPFNTYKYAGLPPGPIYMPSVNSIDAVLNAESHNYIYMCAKPGYNSEHVFAETNRQHEINASKYHRWLNQEGIK